MTEHYSKAERADYSKYIRTTLASRHVHVKMPQIPAPGSHPNEKRIRTPNSPHPKACGLRPVRLSGPPLSHARAQPLEEVHGPLLSGVQPAFARVVHSDLDVW